MEKVFLAFNTNKTEEVIIYLTEDRITKQQTVRYWRTPKMDGEMAWLLVQGFIHNYLSIKTKKIKKRNLSG